ncbi:MAG: ankyrin repeat domain-containing protein [Candidatus Xenobia bacterium]
MSIFEATRRGDATAVEVFLRYDKAAPHERARQGETPLHVAVEFSHIYVARLLLEAGADVNARTAQGLTPLHLALMLENPVPMARLLLGHGANPRLKDNSAVTPVHLAARHAALPDAPDLFAVLMEHGGEVNARDQKGETVLHRVAQALHEREGGVDTVRLLLDWGADRSLRDQSLRLPLDYRPLTPEVVELLQPPPEDGQPQLRKRTALRGAGKSGGRRRTAGRDIDVQAEYGD